MVWSNNWNDVYPGRSWLTTNTNCDGEGTYWGNAARRDVYTPSGACPSSIHSDYISSSTWCSRNNMSGNGSAVVNIQRRLNRFWPTRGWTSSSAPRPTAALKVDGDYGSLTRAMVRWYQAYWDLPADGYVGQQTWNDRLRWTAP